MSAVRGVIFDKDGTLLDFHGTWDEAVGVAFDAVTDEGARQAAAANVGFDLATRTILEGSAFIAETNEVMAELIGEWIDPAMFESELLAASVHTLRAMDGAHDLLDQLNRRSVPLAVATNDAEHFALQQMDQLGWREHFAAIVGYDSGYGAKPDPGMVLATASACGLEATQVAMVGDSAHDMRAAQRAGALAVCLGDHPEAIAIADVCVAELSEILGLVE